MRLLPLHLDRSQTTPSVQVGSCQGTDYVLCIRTEGPRVSLPPLYPDGSSQGSDYSLRIRFEVRRGQTTPSIPHLKFPGQVVSSVPGLIECSRVRRPPLRSEGRSPGMDYPLRTRSGRSRGQTVRPCRVENPNVTPPTGFRIGASDLEVWVRDREGVGPPAPQREWTFTPSLSRTRAPHKHLTHPPQWGKGLFLCPSPSGFKCDLDRFRPLYRTGEKRTFGSDPAVTRGRLPRG